MTIRRPVLALTALSLLLTASVVTAGYEEGVAAFKAGNYDQAIAEFQQFVEERPDVHAGYQMLGLSLLRARKAADAVPQFAKALELAGENPRDRTYLGQAQVASGKFREALSTFNSLDLGSLPPAVQTQVHQARARCHARLGNTSEAASALGRAADLKPGDAGARYEYGQMLWDDAQIDPAIAAFERAVSMDGGQQAWRVKLVNALKVKGRKTTGGAKAGVYRKAEQHARTLANSNPSYDNLLLLGEVQLGAKSYDSAASTFQQAISKNGRDWHSHYYLGQAFGSMERFADAEAPLGTALGLASGDAKNQVNSYLGFVYEKQKKYAESIDAYEKAGNAGGATRVRENQQIAQENAEADRFNADIEELKRQQDALRDELDGVPGGGTNEPPRH